MVIGRNGEGSFTDAQRAIDKVKGVIIGRQAALGNGNGIAADRTVCVSAGAYAGRPGEHTIVFTIYKTGDGVA